MGWYETLAERRGRQWVSIGRVLPLNSCLVCCLNHLSKIQISLARTVLPLYSHIRAHIRTYKHPRTLASIYLLRQMMFTGVSFFIRCLKEMKKKKQKNKNLFTSHFQNEKHLCHYYLSMYRKPLTKIKYNKKAQGKIIRI